MGHQHIDLKTDQFGGQLREQIILSIRPANIYDEVFPFSS